MPNWCENTLWVWDEQNRPSELERFRADNRSLSHHDIGSAQKHTFLMHAHNSTVPRLRVDGPQLPSEICARIFESCRITKCLSELSFAKSVPHSDAN